MALREVCLEADVRYSQGMFDGKFNVVMSDGRRTPLGGSHGYLGSTDRPEYVFSLRVHTYDQSTKKSNFRYAYLSESVAFLEGTKEPLSKMVQGVKEHGDRFHFRDLLYLPVVDNLHWLHDVAPSQKLQATWELQRATVLVDRFMTSTEWKAKEAKSNHNWGDFLYDFEQEKLEAYKVWWDEQGMGRYVGKVNLVKRRWANFWDYTVFRGEV